MATYLIAAWLIVQVLDVVGPSLGLGDRAMTVAVVVLAVGFPLVAMVSWFFDLTSRGLVRDEDDGGPERTSGSGVPYVIIAMLASALGVSLFLRGGEPTVSPGPGALVDAAAAVPVIAVLPLDTLGTASEDGFAEGLHADLIATLSRIQSLRVISRRSVSRYADDRPSAVEIARRLSAQVILEGSVQRVGDIVRIQVQLVDGRNNGNLWSDLFERPLTALNLFAIQNDIARTIAANLRLALSGDEQRDLERTPTQDFSAYRAYLLGRQRLAQRTSTSVVEAERFFREATEQDPNYAEAWAGIGEAIFQQHGYASLPREPMLRTAMPPVQTALRLNPNLSEAHAVLGALRSESGDAQGAEESFRRAIDLNPSNAMPHLWLGTLKYSAARFDEAENWHRRALKLDPLSPTLNNVLAQDFLALDRIDEAAQQYRQSLAIDPEFPATLAHLSELERGGFGRPDKALPLIARAYSLDPRHSEYAALAAQSLLELGDIQSAEPWVRIAMQTAPDQFWPARVNLLLALAAGDDDAIGAALDHYEAQLGGAWLTLVARRDRLLARGDTAAARALFATATPQFFKEPPEVSRHDYYLAPALAVVHLAAGEETAARVLLDAAAVQIDDLRADGHDEFDISEVEIHALGGRTEAALDALESGITNDYLHLWWLYPKNANFAPLSAEPRFQAVIARIESRMQALRDSLDSAVLLPPALAAN